MTIRFLSYRVLGMLRIETRSEESAGTGVVVKDGRIIRPSMYREAEESRQYAEQVKSGPIDQLCVFCSNAVRKRLLHEYDSFYVINARPAYAHFDGQRVASHELLIPHRHVNTLRKLGLSARQDIEQYLWFREDALRGDPDVRFQDYLRTPGNPSKSIDHLHIHMFELGLEPIKKLSYDAENGVTKLEFNNLSPEDIDELNRTRQD